ncbi:MAG: endonuclease/exonuclease/phosphatase family protein, partial [Flammeovirgaceae bacterium]|nr:endonuclease/exonuclease/phosphatase family protein [Flammeovirgaceae bacterium]MDW8288529.1 endonuclease/exonuclease/phosphatase family protein [Flammeovirgaceae bacterium]
AIESFRSLNPHLIAFQEIDFASHRSYEVNQLEEIANALKFPYGAWAINWDKKYVPFPYFPPSVHFGKILSGQAILSKFPIEKHQRIALERVKSHPFYYDAFYLDRLLEIAELRIKNKKVVLMNVHLEAFDANTRKNQMLYVRNVYQEIAKFAPVLLIGDFNSVPPSSEMPETEIDILLKAENIESACPSSEFHLPSSYTFPSNNPNEQIDYIFYNPDRIEKVEWNVLTSFGDISDHLPVMMKFRLK